MESLVSTGRNRTVQTAVLILVSFMLFANALPNRFIWDDNWLVADNAHIRTGKNIPLFFTPHYWTDLHPIPSPGQYRPIRTLTFAVDYCFWKLNPLGYHLTNLVLHALNVLLVYLLISRLLRGKDGGENAKRGAERSLPFLAALLFAAHPVHTESVTFVKNRAELLAGLFFLLSVLLFLKAAREKKTGQSRLFLSISLLFFLLALLSKEIALALPGILVAWTFCFCSGKTRTVAFARTLPFWGLLPLYFWFRQHFLQFAPAGGEKDVLSLWQNGLAVCKTLGYYFYLLCFPVRLNANIPFAIPETIFSSAVLLPALAALLLGLLIVVAFCRGQGLFCFSLAWMLLTLVPISNLVYLSSRPIAEQRLYLPSLGFCLLLALIFHGLSMRRSGFWRGKRWTIMVVFGVIFLLYAVQTVFRNRDWRNEQIFFSRMQADSPRSSRMHINYGYALAAAGKLREALPHYYAALSAKPESAGVHFNLGSIYAQLGRFPSALSHFLAAARLQPENAQAHFQAGNIYLQEGEIDPAIFCYTRALALDPGLAAAHYNLGIALTKKNRPQEAMNHYRAVLRINPDHADAHHKLGVLLAGQGKLEEALWHFFAVTRLSPQEPDAYYNIGSIYRYQGNFVKARQFFVKARERGEKIEKEEEYLP